MKIRPTAIPDVLEIEPVVHGDPRGFFLESWNQRVFAKAGLDFEFVQDNHSRSAGGILRGLHYQIDRPQGKLVRVITGRVYDVAVDVRRSSPTFGRWVGVWLDCDRSNMLWVPPGFAHGFYVALGGADFVYKCTDFYSPEGERVIRWDDPHLGIEWPLAGYAPPEVSERDAAGQPFAQAETLP